MPVRTKLENCGTDASIFIDNTAGADLLRLQNNGSDVFVVQADGDTSIDGVANLNNGAIVTGTLNVNTITPTASMTIGSTSQTLSLQGNSSSAFTATGGGFTTAIGFNIGSGGTAPSGNITYNFRNDNTVSPGTYDVCTTAGNCTGVGGSVTTAGGTPGRLAKFSSSSAIADSIVSESGSLITIAGSALIQGSSGLTLGTASSVNGQLVFNNASNGNTITFSPSVASSNRSITVPNASGTLAVSASGPIALDANGNLTCATCLTSGGGGGSAGVSSLDGLTGALTLANSSGSSTTITIDDASTSQKGIAQFNSTNFSASSGTINTIQNIASSSSPTFTNMNLQGTTGLTIGSTSNLGKLNFLDGTADGFTATLQPVTLTASRTISVPNASGTLAVSASGNIQLSAAGNVTIVNNPTFSTSVTTPIIQSSGTLAITPGGALTVGAANQQFTMQGTGASTITATTGANTTTVSFVAPSANTTIRFPSLSAGTYNLCTDSGNCLGGASGGANTALSNLSGVAINTSLLSGSTAIDLGSNANAFRDLYLGGSATNNFRFTGTASAARTLTIPDASGTLAVSASGNIALSGAGNLTFTGLLPIANGGTAGNSIATAQSNLQVANYTLSNLDSGIALNQTLKPDTAGGRDLGTTALPFGSLYVGNAATNNIRLTGTATTARTVTFSDNGGTVALISPTNQQSGNINISGTVTSGQINGQTISSNAIFSGSMTVQGSFGINLGVASTTNGIAVFRSSSGSGFVRFVPANPGSTQYTLTMPAEDGTLCSTAGSVACIGVYGSASGSANYIQNQNSIDQPANFRISGNARSASVTTTSIDVPTAGNSLTIGGVNATSTIDIGNTTSTTALNLIAGSSGHVDVTRGILRLGSPSSVAGALHLFGSSNGFSTAIQSAPLTIGNRILTLPDTAGVADTFCLEVLENCSGEATTLQESYEAHIDNGAEDTTISLTSSDNSLVVSNPSIGGSGSDYVLKVQQLATGSTKSGLLVSNSGGSSGYSLRVNDGGDSDTSPFMIDSVGRVNIGSSDFTNVGDDDLLTLTANGGINGSGTDDPTIRFVMGESSTYAAGLKFYRSSSPTSLQGQIGFSGGIRIETPLGAGSDNISINSLDSGTITLKSGDSSASPQLFVESTRLRYSQSNNDQFIVSSTGGYFRNNVGIGDISPNSLLTVGAGDAFQVDSTGAIIEVQGITTMGNILPSAAGTIDLGSTSAEFRSIYLADNTGINFGLDQDAVLAYDETTDDRVELNSPVGTGANLFIEDRFSLGVDARTIADNGAGTAAALTLNPTSSYVAVTCNDTVGGCDITLSEATPVKSGNLLYVINLSANNINFADTSAVTELAGAYAAGQYDAIHMLYVTDRWVEISRSNN